MAVVIDNINRLLEGNIGGVTHFQLIDVKACPTLTVINKTISYNLESLAWSSIYPTAKTIDFSVTPKFIKKTRFYTSKVIFKVPKHRLSIDLTIEKFYRTRWILLLHTANGDKILLGTKDAPLKFKEDDLKYKGKSTQRNEYRLRFEVLSRDKPVFYTYVEEMQEVILPNYMLWENGYQAFWEDGTPIEFED